MTSFAENMDNKQSETKMWKTTQTKRNARKNCLHFVPLISLDGYCHCTTPATIVQYYRFMRSLLHSAYGTFFPFQAKQNQTRLVIRRNGVYLTATGVGYSCGWVPDSDWLSANGPNPFSGKYLFNFHNIFPSMN